MRDTIAKIIDPHSFLDIPFTDEQVLLDLVEQSKQDALRKADRLIPALAADAKGAGPVASDKGATEAADRLRRQLAAAHPNHKTMFVYVEDLRAALGAGSAPDGWRQAQETSDAQN